MSSQDNKGNDKDNVVNLAAMRRRQETLLRRGQPLKETRLAAPRKGAQAKGAHSRGRQGRGSVRWYHYLQFLLFMALVAYFMQLCQGGR